MKERGNLVGKCLTCFCWEFGKAVGVFGSEDFKAPCTEWSSYGYTQYTPYNGFCHKWDDAVIPNRK